jgi:hypothetical protein
MTKVILHGSIKEIRGKLGNLIFRKLKDGTIVVSAAPPKKDRRQKKRAKEKRSPAQKAQNNRFTEASAYGTVAQFEPVYVKLAAAAPTKTAYNFAVSDWCHPPEIHVIERKKGRIRVKAVDNVMVTRVRVSVLGEDRQVVEAGEAVKKNRDWWEFATEVQGSTITAEAWDLPGHVTRFVMQQ